MPKPVRKMQKANAAAQAAVLPKIPSELLAQLVKGPMSPEAVQEASTAFKKALIERALGAEMNHHLGYPAGADKPAAATNQRNGKSGKTVLTDDGPVRIDVPRGRTGEFEPELIGSGSEAIMDPSPKKPSRMRWRTYEKIQKRCDRYETTYDAGLWSVLERLMARR